MISSQNEIMKMSRKKIRSAVCLLSDNGLNKHLHKIGMIEYPTCRACWEDEEDSQECSVLGSLRIRYFRIQFLQLIMVKNVLRFINDTKLTQKSFSINSLATLQISDKFDKFSHFLFEYYYIPVALLVENLIF